MNSRKIKFITLLILGVFIIIFSLISDLLRDRVYQIGPAQIVLLIIGLLIICISLYIHFVKELTIVGMMADISGFLERINGIIGKYHESKKARKPVDNKIQEIGIFALFGVIAVLYTLGRWNGNSPFIFLGSDASTISAYAASIDHPGVFDQDYMFSNALRKAESYVSLHVPLIRWLALITGNYGNAFLVLLPFTIFLKLLGFYYLGKLLFKKPLYGLVLACITYPIIFTGVKDYWGLMGDALPRNLFEIAFPWLIAFSIKWIDQPKKWVVLGLLLGGLTYIHSISAVGIFGAIIFVLFFGSKISIKNKITFLLRPVLLYLILLIPFLFGYQKNVTETSLDYQSGLLLLNNLFETHRNLSGIFQNFVSVLFQSGILLFFIFSLIVFVVIRDIWNNATIKIIFLWFCGIFLFTFVLTLIEQFIETELEILPIQFLLIRNIRYLPPIMVILIFVILNNLHERAKSVKYQHLFSYSVKSLTGILSIIIFALIIFTNQQPNYVIKQLNCFSSGHISCQTEREKNSIDIIDSLKNYSDEDDVILGLPPLTLTFERSIRFEGLRSMGLNLPDYTRTSKLDMIKKIGQKLGPWNKIEHFKYEDKLDAYLELAKEVDATLFIIQRDSFPESQIEQLDFLYSNNDYLLVRP